jgi:hypothetical protein
LPNPIPPWAGHMHPTHMHPTHMHPCASLGDAAERLAKFDHRNWGWQPMLRV